MTKRHLFSQEELIDTRDDYYGWRLWMESEDRRAEGFENYCFDHFWNQIGADFLNILHPEERALILADEPICGNAVLWSLYIWLVLDEKRLKVMLGAYVDSERDAFEIWCCNEIGEMNL